MSDSGRASPVAGQRGWVSPVVALLVLAAAWRLVLGTRYYGWEESDYGNLAMARGVLESGFTHFDMNHLPLFYAASAAVLALVGDVIVATRVVSLLGGLATVALVVLLAWRLGGDRHRVEAAWLAGLLVVFQPELALYSASSLREPLYAALLLGCLAALGRERLAAASVLAGLAFLVRFDALLILSPLLLLHALGRAPRIRRGLALALPLLLVVSLWSLYCHVDHGNWRFWEHSVSVNVDTGLGGEAELPGQWWRNGLQVALALLLRVLPGHLGHLLAVAGLLTVPLLALRGHGLARSTAALWLLATGFWLCIGFVGQHDPGHNLYWKWLMPVAPLWGLAAGVGLAWVWARLRRSLGAPAAWGLVLAALGTVLIQQWAETRRQLEVSAQLYKPQLELALYIEQEIPESVPMVLDNIPGCYIDRRPHQRRLHNWMDIPQPEGGREGLGAWLAQEEIGYVLWFREEWTQAPVVAPWLTSGGTQRLGSVTLVELEREDAYGWIWYVVQANTAP